MKELKEMTSEELLEQIKAESNAELYGNVDEPENDDVKEQNVKQLKSDFRKFTNLIKKLKKAKASMKEMEIKYKDNVELQEYIKLIKEVNELDVNIDNARKGYLYDSAILSPNTPLENTDVKISLTMPHDREDFDKDKFIEDYSIEEYRKYITTKSVKGNIKFKIKE